jgi:hypothetical protein
MFCSAFLKSQPNEIGIFLSTLLLWLLLFTVFWLITSPRLSFYSNERFSERSGIERLSWKRCIIFISLLSIDLSWSSPFFFCSLFHFDSSEYNHSWSTFCTKNPSHDGILFCPVWHRLPTNWRSLLKAFIVSLRTNNTMQPATDRRFDCLLPLLTLPVIYFLFIYCPLYCLSPCS